MDRVKQINKLSEDEFDLLVIGGGINGAGIARDASLRGLKVALIDKGDFSSGTSSKSAKLIHGGLRYIEKFQFKMVFESVRERNLLLELAPHLVKPLEFVVPIYKEDRVPKWFLLLGLVVYDIFSGLKRPRHRRLSKKKIVELFPWLKEDGLKGGGLYTDARADDSRLTIANVQSADENNAIVANYVKAIDIENSEPMKCVSVKDMLSNHEFKIKCKIVVAVIGVWQDQLFTAHKKLPKIIPSTGSHFVIKQNLGNDRALGFIYQQAKSTGYIIPWKNHTIIGTTDIPFEGNLDNILPSQEDLDFLLNEVNRIIRNENSITASDIFSAFAGARPLFYSKAEVTDISREFKIAELEDGIIVVTGGKLTTYRLLAEKTVNKVCKKLKRRRVRCLTHKLPLPGSDVEDYSYFYSEYYKKLSDMGFKDETVDHLLNTYGTRVKNILELIRKDESLKRKISEAKPHIYAEIPYLVQNEYVCRIEDVFFGRLHLDLTLDNGFDCINVIAHEVKESFNLSNVEIEDQIKEYRKYIKSIRDFK